MTAASFFTDAYTETAVIPAEEHLHDEVTISFRPATPAQYAVLVDLAGRQVEFTRAATDLLEKSLLSWSITDANGTAVPIKGNVGKLRPQLFSKIANMVAGFTPNIREQREADLKN
jgi:hypothetical protein